MDWKNKEYRNPSLQKRLDWMRNEADKIFGINWLEKRLRDSITHKESITSELSIIEYCQQQEEDYELLFARCYLQKLLYSYYDVKLLYNSCADKLNFLIKLHERRENSIETFAPMNMSDVWDEIIDDNNSWRSLAAGLYQQKKMSQEEVSKLIEVASELILMTSILTGHADDYGFSIDSKIYDIYNNPKGRVVNSLSDINQKIVVFFTNGTLSVEEKNQLYFLLLAMWARRLLESKEIPSFVRMVGNAYPALFNEERTEEIVIMSLQNMNDKADQYFDEYIKDQSTMIGYIDLMYPPKKDGKRRKVCEKAVNLANKLFLELK